MLSGEELLSFFGYESWDEWARDQERESSDLGEPGELPAHVREAMERSWSPAETPGEVDHPERVTPWRTIAEELGEQAPSTPANRPDSTQQSGTRSTASSGMISTASAAGRSTERSKEMTMTTIDSDRESFRQRALASRRLIRGGDSEAANADTAAAEALAAKWDAQGSLGEFLVPLTAEGEKSWVRYSAASYLLANGHSDVAVPALEDVQAGNGLAALGAERLLATWRKANG